MAKLYRVTLSDEERDLLAGISERGSHKSQRVINSLILLNCDEAEGNERRVTNEDVAAVLRVSTRKIERVKKRFVEDGLEVALGSRQGQRQHYERKADGEFEAKLVALACSKPPEGHSQWSLRLLADKAVELEFVDSVSYETVRRTLKKTNLSLGAKSAG